VEGPSPGNVVNRLHLGQGTQVTPDLEQLAHAHGVATTYENWAGKPVEVSYQEMIARGNVRVRKQGEFFGDADWVSYSELKGVMIFYGTKDNPAEVHRQKGQGIRDEKIQGERIKYFTKTRTFEVEGGTTLSQ